MEIKKYGLTEDEVAKLTKEGFDEETMFALALERIADNAVNTDILKLDEIRDALYEKHPDLPDPVADWLTEAMLKHPEEAEKAAQTIEDWVKGHADDMPEEFNKPGIIIPTKRAAAQFWAKKALGENPDPDPCWYGGKLLAFIINEVIKDEAILKPVLEVTCAEPIY